MEMSANKAAYRRVLLKVSGEALGGESGRGIDFDFLKSVCGAVMDCVKNGAQVAITVGGGNFWRGVKDGGGKMERTRADQMGMMATVMNCLALQDCFIQLGQPARVMTMIGVGPVAELYEHDRAIRHLEKGRVVIFGCGTGSPYFSTDTAAVLKGVEIGADVVLMAKNIDGVYSADPHTDPTAVRYDEIAYDEILGKHLGVVDSTAACMGRDNAMPLMLFRLSPEDIRRVIGGEKAGTMVR